MCHLQRRWMGKQAIVDSAIKDGRLHGRHLLHQALLHRLIHSTISGLIARRNAEQRN
jgi:hypothetical protein